MATKNPIPITAGTISETSLETALKTGAWTAMESLGEPKVEESGGQTVRFRKENLGSCVRLRGTLKMKEAVKKGEVMFTLPAVARPAANIHVPLGCTPGCVNVLVETTGPVKLEFAELKIGEFAFLDGISFNIT
jgi:hypothetical protein